MTQSQDGKSPPAVARIVVVDDEEEMCRILARILAAEHYDVTTFSRPLEAIAHIRRTAPDLVLTDMRMPDATGMDVLRAAREANPFCGVVVMTAYGTIEGGVEAMRAGAHDYLTKPWKIDELLLTLAKALEASQLRRENLSLSETLRRQSEGSDLLGDSAPMRTVLETIRKVAPTDAAVLICGESGTGKELAARAIHKQSLRAAGRFVAINCASIPETLLESELFGHEKGAFTGADKQKLGLVELAHGGTLFLDEIGELPLTLQAKILRVLQEREIQRVGGTQTIPVDIRLVAATNRDLQKAIEAREFRADLFFRLNVITITLPPLRDRREDIPVLIAHFLARAGRKMHKPAVRIEPAALDALQCYSYPGNVRELENLIERMVVMCDGDVIRLEDVPLDLRTARQPVATSTRTQIPQPTEYKDAKDQFEREYLLRVIEAAGGNMTEAARLSGISRRHLYEKMERLGIKPTRPQ
ncbi:MAG: sigma-54 dependent transcriptional regulator [Candidatus Sumerlaeaceae bacterium]|nr:sigma-54 dependent transcriptional regulator [Candidatus Sumerlaeaceae bacterium]